MNIGMIHFRVGETDGVSLEMDKWKVVLEQKGHKVYYISGTSGTSDALIIPEMDYRGIEDGKINAMCFESLEPGDGEAIKASIEDMANRIETKLTQFIKDYHLKLLIPNNLLSLGRSPHIALAIQRASLMAEISVIGHHHDFYWERDYFEHPSCDYVKKLLDNYFPPKDLNMKHVVINTPAKVDLLFKKGLKSQVVPNVFDFEAPTWVKDDYNSSYKSDMGIHDNEVVFLQATRVTNRKAIELAIDLIAMLNTKKYRDRLIGKQLYNGKIFDDKTKLTLAVVGLHEGGDNYEKRLFKYGEAKGVNVLVKPELIDHSRHVREDGHKIYALWDAYVYCDLITYPSIYEGWGNQFLEGVFAKRPQVVFEYSVFESDIKPYDFDYISLGNTYHLKEDKLAEVDKSVLELAAESVIRYLTDANVYKRSVEKNFEIGREYFSLKALSKMLDRIV